MNILKSIILEGQDEDYQVDTLPRFDVSRTRPHSYRPGMETFLRRCIEKLVRKPNIKEQRCTIMAQRATSNHLCANNVQHGTTKAHLRYSLVQSMRNLERVPGQQTQPNEFMHNDGQ